MKTPIIIIFKTPKAVFTFEGKYCSVSGFLVQQAGCTKRVSKDY
ncbi:hypothetical protein [Vibrio sp. JC009]|nr:hypothetical protein [Vibrio sp. JC009]